MILKKILMKKIIIMHIFSTYIYREENEFEILS